MRKLRNVKNVETQVKRDKLELLGWQEILDGKKI